MSNQQQIDDWNRTQAHYSQARHFTPGRQNTQYDRLEKGAPRQMNLLVVLHNDATSAEAGKQRVDLIVDSGSYDRKAEHANGHLVNSYDEEAGVTDHTTLYSDKEMGLISASAGMPARLQNRPEGGPPGAQIYSIRAQVRENENGQLVIDTDAPMSPGPGASRYSLHDVQEGMNRVDQPVSYGQPMAEREQSLRTSPPPPPAFTQVQRSEPRQVPVTAVNSQAGLAAHQGPKHSYPSVPRPGEPGSRFNPTVRERQPQPLGQQVDPSKMIQVPTFPTAAAVPDAKPLSPVSATKKLSAPAQKFVDRLGELPQSKEDSSSARTVKATLSGVARGMQAGLAAQAQGRPDLSTRLGEMAAVAEQSSPVAEPVKRPISETYDYQFETPDAGDSSGPEYG